MKSQLGFKLNLFFFVSLFSCILNIPRSPQVFSDTLEMHSLPIRVFHRVNAIVVLMILSVVKERLLQTSRC